MFRTRSITCSRIAHSAGLNYILRLTALSLSGIHIFKYLLGRKTTFGQEIHICNFHMQVLFTLTELILS